MGMEASEEEMNLLREELGLNEPLTVQYGMWLKEILSLQFGRSFTSGQPISKIIRVRLGPTLLLSATALAIAVVLGILLGTFAALRRNTLVDHALTFVSFFFVSASCKRRITS